MEKPQYSRKDKMKKLVILGESHTRSFSHRENILPFFMDTGKMINLEKSNLPHINERITKIKSEIDFNNNVVFLYIGEPNCRLKVRGHWEPHWDEIKKGIKVNPNVDKEYLNECIDNMDMIDMGHIDYIITPTGAYDPVIPSLKYFNDLLKEKYGSKVIDIFTNTIDKDMRVLDEYKAKDWFADPIHLNSKVSEDLIHILEQRGIIDNINDYKSDIDGYFGTHLILKNIKKSNFGSYVIK